MIYDEASQDFITSSTRRGSGSFSYFVVDTETQYLIFEEKPPDIRTTSFVAALQGILRQDTTAYRFDLDRVPDIEDFSSWLSQTQRVSKFRVSVRPPNPHWPDRPRALRDLVQESNAAQVTIEARSAESGPGLDVENSDLRAFWEHAGLGYGIISGTGETDDGRTRFHSNRRTKGQDVETDPNESEPSFLRRMFETLRNLIERQ